VNVHGYLVCDSTATNFQMLLISDVEDLKIANGDPNIPANAMCLLDYSESSLPPSESGIYVDRINHWQNNKDAWVQSVIISGQSNPEKGVVRVFDIPVSDMQTVLGSNTQVYLGLKDTIMLEDEIEVIFYKDGGTQHFYDFTTPRPPFGSNGVNYGLLT